MIPLKSLLRKCQLLRCEADQMILGWRTLRHVGRRPTESDRTCGEDMSRENKFDLRHPGTTRTPVYAFVQTRNSQSIKLHKSTQ